jgi:hypothetical protein
MSEQKQLKALIVYASITGNTEKVAMRFKQTIELKGQPWGDWKCDIFKVTKKTDRKNIPYHLEDYDLFLVGAPIWAGIPPLYLFDDHQGALGPIMMPAAFAKAMAEGKPMGPPGEGGGMGFQGKGWGPKKGIAFVTYGGQGQGPIEAQAALSCIELRLEGGQVKCIGKFACCGKQWEEPTVDPLAAKLNMMVGDTTVAIAQYKENPNHPDFANLTAEERKMFEKAVKMTEEFSAPGGHRGKFRAWHWDFSRRPTERDLLKAEIFMKDILEEYYGGGIEMYPYSQYVSIS